MARMGQDMAVEVLARIVLEHNKQRVEAIEVVAIRVEMDGGGPLSAKALVLMTRLHAISMRRLLAMQTPGQTLRTPTEGIVANILLQVTLPGIPDKCACPHSHRNSSISTTVVSS